MTKLQLRVHLVSGTSYVERTEDDDPQGRVRIDKAAFAEMSRDKVRYASVERADRFANDRKGSAR